ncbi:MAG: hypothetical protein CMJ34_15195 [Phycisphaerae bacterium]|nr:hypothetical protein [Phycisphaerae bacterium]
MTDPHTDTVPATRGSRFVSACAGFLLVLAAGIAGCNIVVPVAYVIEGPGTIPAEYDLRQASTAVFIDDSENKFPRTSLRGVLGVEITQLLIDNKVMPASMFVDARDMIGLVRAIETNGRRASIERIGREAGVEQVIYVKLEGFSLTLDGVTPRPTAVCSVKVLDLAAGTRVFPLDDSKGRETVGQLREVDPARFDAFAKMRIIEDDLAVRLGRNVAQLFYEHERVNLGENLGIR